MPRAPMFQDVQIQRMREMYELGDCSLAKIAVEFGVSVPTIAKYLRRAGVTVKGRGRPAKKDLTPTIPTPTVVEEVKEETTEPAPLFKF